MFCNNLQNQHLCAILSYTQILTDECGYTAPKLYCFACISVFVFTKIQVVPAFQEATCEPLDNQPQQHKLRPSTGDPL